MTGTFLGILDERIKTTGEQLIFKISLFPSAWVTQLDIEADILQKKLWLEFGCLIACFTFNSSQVQLVTSWLISNKIGFHLFSNEVFWKFCSEFVGNKPHFEFDVDELYQIELKSVPNLV